MHSKSFGKNQEDLISLVNSLDYDILTFTGDMSDKDIIDSSDPFIKLVNGLDNKKDMFYVRGNNGPAVFDNYDNKTEMGYFLEKNNINILKRPYEIKRGNETLWVSRFLNNDEINQSEYIKEDDLKIVVNHYPLEKQFYINSAKYILADYDLILAGHYHGGQYRIPFLGTFFVPNINRIGLFPSKEEVSGLTTWGGYNQYVSRGLGASEYFGTFKFRLFNTPEINVLTLKTK